MENYYFPKELNFPGYFMEIIYEDKNFLIVNKPADLLVHPVENSEENSIVDWLIKKYPMIKNVGDDKKRPGIVHRLDKDTSGILLIAKNQEAFEYFKKLFSASSLELKRNGRDLAFSGQERKIKKKYIALVFGEIKNNSGVIDLPIGKSKADFRKKIAGGKMAGKIREAVTEYKVIKRFKGYTLVEVYPKTGRTHQIRVHFKAIGHSVVCDHLYSSKESVCPHGLSRHFLHALSLEFTDMDGARVKFEADLPEDLENVLKELRG